MRHSAREVTSVMASTLLVWLCLGCGSATTEEPGDVVADLVLPDVELDGVADQSDLRSLPEMDFDGPLSAPKSAFLPVVVTMADPLFTGEVEVFVGVQKWQVPIVRGRGSVLVQVGGDPALMTLRGFSSSGVTITVESRAERALSGLLSGADLAWDAQADIVIEAEAEVPAGSTLTVGPGTRILMGPKARLKVAGKLVTQGTHEEPVWFLPSQDTWGELSVTGEAELTHTWFTGGGGDPAQAFGHSESQPVIRASAGSKVVMSFGGITDSPGKAFGTQSAQVQLEDLLISRCDTGGEHKGSAVTLRRCHILEIPDGDGVFSDDDNDAIYLNDPGDDPGDGPLCLLEDSVFAVGEDDAVDHNGSNVTLRRLWVAGFRHEGLAASKGGTVHVEESVVSGCDQGIEVGYGSPTVTVDHCVVTNNNVGLRWGDSYDWESLGTLAVTSSICVANQHSNVLFTDDQQGPAPADAVTIGCSMVDSPQWDTVGTNGAGIPSLDASFCPASGSVTVASQCQPIGLGGCP